MKKHCLSLVATAVSLFFVVGLQAAYLIEIDTDGADDGILTYSPDFSFGGDTTAAGQSSASGAIGLNGGDSIFGGNGSAFPDTYVYTYSPDSQVDNLFLTAGSPLGDGNYASGATGGAAGTYVVYATWPVTSNVDGGLTHYDIQSGTNSVSVALDQNGLGGNVWVKLGEIDYTSGAITVTQTCTLNNFVSMRAAGLLIERLSDGGGDVYTGAPGWFILGSGAQRRFGIAFERNKDFAKTNHLAVLRSTNLIDWITTDLKLYSVLDLNTNTELVAFYSMTPMDTMNSEYLRITANPKMPVTPPDYVAMTFDDGPHPTLTPQLLDILAARNIRATFFVTGINAQWYPQIIRRMINEGHQVGNHTMTHARLTDLTEPEVIVEVAGCEDAIVAAGTVVPSVLRPPYGSRTAALEALFLSEFGYSTILWNIDPRDWDTGVVTDQEVIDAVINGVADWFHPPVPSYGPIVLLHDIHARTIAVTPTILDTLLAQGYSFVTISELLELKAN